MTWRARRAWGMRRSPADVNAAPRVERLNSGRPIRRSSAAIRLDTDGWAKPSALAARPKLPCSAAARNTRRSSNSMLIARDYENASHLRSTALSLRRPALGDEHDLLAQRGGRRGDAGRAWLHLEGHARHDRRGPRRRARARRGVQSWRLPAPPHR